MENKEKMNPFKELEVGNVFETEEIIFPEKNLILGFLWEGDLQIHSNSQVMAGHPFGDKIVHGSSVVSMTLGLFLKMEPIGDAVAKLQEINTSYVNPVYVEDAIKARFQIDSKQQVSDNAVSIAFHFNIFVNAKDLVCKGDAVMSLTLKV